MKRLNRRQFVQAATAASLGVALSPAGLSAPAFASGEQADAAFGGLLKRYVVRGGDGVNRVRYADWQASGHGDLKAYIGSLQAMRPSAMPRPAEMAYWINLYNATTLDVVLDHYPVRSIRDIDLGGGLFGSGPWKAGLVTVEGRTLSLDRIEHDILRARFREPLVHYALNCASVGCPDLLSRPWAADTLSRQFDAGARAYVNHPRGLAVEERRLRASKIYSWYADDFGGRSGLKEHWQAYADPQLAARLARFTRPQSYFYDWNLNDAG